MTDMSDTGIDALDRLVAIEEIRQLKARYFRLLDQKDFDAFATVFTEDFRYLDDAKQMELVGRDAFVSFIAERHARSVSVHEGHDSEIELDSSDEAHGIWAMNDMVILPRDTNGRTIQHGSGHYTERYRRVSGRWCIARSHLSRLWLSIEQQDQEFPHVV